MFQDCQDVQPTHTHPGRRQAVPAESLRRAHQMCVLAMASYGLQAAPWAKGRCVAVFASACEYSGGVSNCM